jgi:hypothetical protein
MTGTLFPVSAGDVALTTDEWYTPPWLFKAAGLVFDMDVCAPVDAAFRTCPAREYLTVVEDGLTAGWHGTIWCNPPYSKAHPWVDKFIAHDSGLMLVMGRPELMWRGKLTAAADAVCLLAVDFGRPDGTVARLPWVQILSARGRSCVDALARVAAADPWTQGAYHVRP